MSRQLLLIATALAIHAGRAEATVSPYYCAFQVGDPQITAVPNYPWFAPKTIVPIYTDSYPGLEPWAMAQVTQSTFETQLARALSIMNEQLGSSVELRYMGAISAPSEFYTGAVLIYGNSDCHVGGYDFADVHGYSSGGVEYWSGGIVGINKYLAAPAGTSCSTLPPHPVRDNRVSDGRRHRSGLHINARAWTCGVRPRACRQHNRPELLRFWPTQLHERNDP